MLLSGYATTNMIKQPTLKAVDNELFVWQLTRQAAENDGSMGQWIVWSGVCRIVVDDHGRRVRFSAHFGRRAISTEGLHNVL